MTHASRAFGLLAQSVSARVGVAIATTDAGARSFGEWSGGVAWSTIKVPLALAAVRAGVASATQLRATIVLSDNDAAEELWSRLGDRAAQLVQSVLRDAGDSDTVVESQRLRTEYTPFGQTQWSLSGQAKFAAELSQLPGSSRVIALMANLCQDHRWGLSAKGLAAKGGWGPGLGGDFLVRQLALGPAGIGIALAAEVSDGGYEHGVDVVNTLADWVVDEGLAG